MKKLHWEILAGGVFVAGGSYVAYRFLYQFNNFWNAQNIWSLVLMFCWFVVATGYWRQGTIIHKARSASHVSLLLPSAVFVVQCILFIKGIYYNDMALVAGAVLVNSAVVFDIYQIIKFYRR